MADPALDNVILLANWDGTNNDTTYTPEIGGDVSFSGDARLDSGVTLFGNTTAYVDGDGDKLTWGSAADVQFLHDDTEDWTIELWADRASLAESGYLLATRGTNCGVLLAVNDAGGVEFYIFRHAGDRLMAFSDEDVVSANTMHYFKITYAKSTRTCKVRVDGDVIASGTAATFSGTADSNFAMTLGAAANSTFRQCEVNYGPVRITRGEALDDDDVPTGIFPDTQPLTAIISAAGPLGQPRAVAFNDFTSVITDTRIFYRMVMTGDPPVTVPISSWQATLQVDRSHYVQCVIPAVDPYVATIAERQNAEEFIISRVAVDRGSEIEVELARAPIQTTSLARGPTNYTCTLAGFSEGAAAPEAPRVRVLQEIRSINVSAQGKFRVRAAIDWFLRPGDTATAGDTQFTADYINYYSTSAGESYMDVGDR